MTEPLSALKRLERLERLVEELYAAQGLPMPPGATPGPPPAAPTRQPASAGIPGRVGLEPTPRSSLAPSFSPRDLLSEGVFAKVGILLLFLGLAALFQYAVEQGWLTPVLRLAAGALISAVLLGVSLRLPPARERFARLLQGGAAATAFITVYAAYAIYHLVPVGGSLALAGAITLAGFLAAIRSSRAEMAVIAALGGLAAPWLLWIAPEGAAALPEGAASGVAAWLAILFVAAAWLHQRRPWYSFVATIFGAGSLSLAAALGRSEPGYVLAGTVAAFWLAAVIVPYGRESLARLHSGLATPAQAPWPERASDRILVQGAYFAVATYVTAVLLARALSLQGQDATLLHLSLAVLLAGLVAVLRGVDRGRMEAAATAAAVLVIPAMFELFDRSYAVLVLAALAVGCHLLARRTDFGSLAWVAHGIYALVFLVQWSTLGDPAAFDGGALALLGALGFALLSAALLRDVERRNYLVAAHIFLLLWTGAEFRRLDGGMALVSIVWGAYGALLFAVSLALRLELVRLAALATLALLAVKLLVVDTAAVSMLWRILLFLGFGGVFLGVSYLTRRPVSEPGAVNVPGGP